MEIKWINEWTAEINGGGPVEFAGVIRGQGCPVIRYYAPTVDDVVDGLVLDEWIFTVRHNGHTIMSSKKRPA